MMMIAAVAEPVVDGPSCRAEGANSGVGPTLRSDPVADAIALPDLPLIAEAERALAEAVARHEAAAIKAQAADDVLGDVRGEMPGLVDRATAGEAVALRAVVSVRQRVRATEAWASFTSTVARRLGETVEHVKTELASAKHTAWLPTLERGIELRIAAARRADRARLAAQWGRGHSPQQVAELEAAKEAGFAAAKPLFDAGNEIIRIACQNGAKFPSNPTFSQPRWPSREVAEREFWRKPMNAEELADALS
jgi:hypothetical protein